MSNAHNSTDTRLTSLENGTSRSSDDTYVGDHRFSTLDKKEGETGVSVASVEIPDGGWAASSTVAGGQVPPYEDNADGLVQIYQFLWRLSRLLFPLLSHQLHTIRDWLDRIRTTVPALLSLPTGSVQEGNSFNPLTPNSLTLQILYAISGQAATVLP
ncbi:11492_t:CDS:2, partial [Acaulospora colombiana]